MELTAGSLHPLELQNQNLSSATSLDPQGMLTVREESPLSSAPFSGLDKQNGGVNCRTKGDFPSSALWALLLGITWKPYTPLWTP